MSEPIKTRLNAAMQDALRTRAKARLGALRLVWAEFKRIEVDERIEIDDQRAIALMGKMVKQRRDSARQYRDAKRPDLAEQELAEIAVIEEFLPQPLDEAALLELIDRAIAQTGACSMRDMGKLMGTLKPQLQGRADMAQVSGLVKAKLA